MINLITSALFLVLIPGISPLKHDQSRILAPSVKQSVVITGIEGTPKNPFEKSPKVRLLAFVFIMHDCPISNQYLPEVKRIFKRFDSQGVKSRLVYEEAGVDIKTLITHSKDFGIGNYTVIDKSFALAKNLGVTITPEAVVTSADGAVLYRGRINDLYVDYGKDAQP